ncbi:glycoside hydrolase family 25 protein [Lachnospiraceae bacterium OttesenSCG-928-D06]|nr:glycoside hydrolase family 25 protein [Lachnospiraceae bacterium OttesenSCG-928-D06]
MDSRLKRLSIMAAFGVILLVVLFVFYLNQNSSGSQNNGNNQNNIGNQSNENQKEPSGTGDQIGNDLTAFQNDPTFFDQEKNEILEAAKDQSKRLSLVVTSVEKDLRVQIVDSSGEPVTGESFFLEIEDLGQYKDLDKDGVIYIADLDAGEYYVSLQPIEGYKVPINDTKIKVKEKVEYIAINDISLLIKTEEEIDAEKEDTEEKEALEDTDATEITTLQPTSANAKVGIDVSKWNGEIDWDKVKNAGVEFAIIRVGYRGSRSGSIVVDPYFETNIRAASAAGVDVGVYFFTQAITEVEAVEEASAVLTLINDYNLQYPVFIDTEGAGGNGRADNLDVEMRTLVCDAFSSTIENAGYNAGVYASRSWYYNNLEAKKLERYCIWLAEYRSVPLYQGYYQMWQYTSKGKIDGIKGNVDMNLSYFE